VCCTITSAWTPLCLCHVATTWTHKKRNVAAISMLLSYCFTRMLSTIIASPLRSQQYIKKWLPTLLYSFGTDRIHLTPPHLKGCCAVFTPRNFHDVFFPPSTFSLPGTPWPSSRESDRGHCLLCSLDDPVWTLLIFAPEPQEEGQEP